MLWKDGLRRHAAPIACALILASCARSTPSALIVAPVTPVPDALLRPCAPPLGLPAAALSAAAVGRLWGRDRVALAACGARHEALGAHVRRMETAEP